MNWTPFEAGGAARFVCAASLLCVPNFSTNAQDLLNDSFTFSGASLHLKMIANPGAGNLISLTSRPDDPANIYVSSQFGSVFSIDSQGIATEWFNYDNAVNAAIPSAFNGYLLAAPGDPQGGLRSVAFHPEFATNGKFYTSAVIDRPSNPSGINYLGNSTSGFGVESAVVEWTYSHQAGQVDSNSYRELFRVQMPVFDHPVKQMGFNPYAQFGDDDYGLLYIAHGDGSLQSPLNGGGLNTGDALGKVLRVNPLQDGGSAYSTPNNPYNSTPGTLDEIYTLGHRNPHHISFGQDMQGNSFPIVAEVGRDNIEEINVLQPGGNYGWSDREGTFVHNSGGGGYINGVAALPANEWQLNDYVYPAAQYDHDANIGDGIVGSAVAGGFVIDNGSDPALQGQYFFADFGSKSGHVYHAALTDLLAAHTQLADGEPPGALTQATIYRATLTLDSDGDGTVDTSADNLNSLLGQSRNDVRFGRGPNGEMYLSSKRTGAVYLVTNSVVPERAFGLIYDAATGELSIDTLGEQLTAYVLEGNGFLEENHNQVLGLNLSSTDTVLSESNPLSTANGIFNIGAVLPANLSAGEFEAYFSAAVYDSVIGDPASDFTLVYQALPADLDGDGDVDGVDVSGCFSAFTGPGGGPPGNPLADLDADGDVDGVDISQAFSAFTGPRTPANVPEPSSLALLGIGGVLAARRHRL